MPKYNPSREDLYEEKPCPVCGQDILEEGAETCSYMCQVQWEAHKEFLEEMAMREMEEDE